MDRDTLEMIHAGLDGRLSHAGREELRSILAADPAAREAHDQLRAVAVALASSPVVEPPRDLRSSVMQAVASSGAGTRRGIQRGPWAPFGLALRYGYAFAAGLAVGFLGLAWYMGSTGSFLSGPGLAGSMSPAQTHADRVPSIVAFAVSAPGIDGAVSLKPGADALALEVDLRAGEPTEVRLTHAPGEVEILGWVRRGPGVGNMATIPDGLAWTMLGEPGLTILLAPRAGAAVDGADLRLDFQRAGVVIHTAVFHLAALDGPDRK